MGTLPRWAKGQQRTCVICGFWYPERDWRIRKKEGKWICWKDDDTLTDRQRAIERSRLLK